MLHGDRLGRLVLLVIWVYMALCVHLERADNGEWKDTEITRTMGHYPSSYCRVTNLVFNSTVASFVFQGKPDVSVETKCNGHIETIWPFQKISRMGSVKCDRHYDKGYIFTIYYYYGSNYFHLHYDMMLPLYLALHDGKKGSLRNMVLMPTVESSRLQVLQWNTPAFKDANKYWMQLLNVIRGNAQLVPLDESLLNAAETVCLDTAYFGTPHFPFEDRALVQGFIRFVKAQLGIPLNRHQDLTQPHRIGIITRPVSRGRAILNEAELVKASSHLGTVDIIEFTGKTFLEQVQLVQRYSVLVGMNGAGLTNALYLPRTSVAVQLVPYNASLNFREFGIWLSSRGPYLEWHNSHPELSHSDEHNVYLNTNTEVHVTEFVQLITEAIAIVNNRVMTEKTEL